ncbi:hypothetical protein [Lactobacillus agrestimuris]|uniref:hypothetical protein n=1 Tax=Lactobacillus agrestimuris TaxID=2941328 RepID=UPI0020430940|nr:hypothetical protein [Lactobacillus agrestimuris]
MKKKSLFTALAAAVLLTSAGTEVLAGGSTAVTQAATKKAKKTTKKTKKASKYATINIKRGARVYKIVFNKSGSKVNKVTLLKNKQGKQMALKGGKASAIWSTKYKGVTYYYIGGASYAVRAKDAKRTSKKKVPSLTSLIKARKAKVDAANNELKAKVNSWKGQIDAAMPKKFTGTVNTETEYFKVDENGKVSKATDKLAKDTKLTVLFKMNDVLSNGDSNIPAYFALTSDNQEIILASQVVTIDNNAASQIPDQKGYEDSVKKYNDLNTQAKNDLEQTKKDLENKLAN